MKAYKQIRADIARLEREAEAARKAESAGVVAKIRKLAAEHDLTAADIGLGSGPQEKDSDRPTTKTGSKKVARKTPAKKAARSGAGVAKYRDPKSGKTWTGFGRAPQCLALAKKREDFLIDSGDGQGEASVAAREKPSVKTIAGKVRPAGKAAGLRVVVAARQRDKLDAIARDTGAAAMTCDSTDAAAVATLFDQATQHLGGPPEVVVYNASQRVRGPFTDVDAAAVAEAVAVTALGAFQVAQQAARRMVPQGRGAILFTGASAGVKGYPQSAAFAMGKFALRGLAQSLARELAPQGIHVGHVVIDGSIRPPGSAAADAGDERLDPDAIAATYLHLLTQPRSAWTWEIEVRPWVERF